MISLLPALCLGLLAQASDASLEDTVHKRFNYASFDCAARVLATNKGAKSPSSILIDQKDLYLRNLCTYTDKHVIVELCQDIRVDTLVLANFEFFSSMFKEFEVLVSKKYPSLGWKSVGNFTAANTRQEQIFAIERPTTFARFLRIDFKTHYGNEYYCLVSSLKVFGKTMMDEFEESTTSPRLRSDAVAVVPEPTAEPPAMRQESVVEERPATTASEPAEPMMEPIGDLIQFFRSASSCKAPRSCIEDGLVHLEGGDSEPQENIFKAIYDRLRHLERNVTVMMGNLRSETVDLGKELEWIKNEVGVVSEGGSLKSFRSGLSSYLKLKLKAKMAVIEASLDRELKRIKKTNRLLMSLVAVASLQTPILLVLLFVVYGILRRGWFRSFLSPPLSSVVVYSPGPSRPLHHYKQAVDHPEADHPEADHLEADHPDASSPIQQNIMDEAQPLLLDDPETDSFIDAKYPRSPMTLREEGSKVPEGPMGPEGFVSPKRPAATVGYQQYPKYQRYQRHQRYQRKVSFFRHGPKRASLTSELQSSANPFSMLPLE